MATTYSANLQSLLSRSADVLSKNPHNPPPAIADFTAMIKANPDAPLTMIISCADPRVVPEHIFGLGVGEAVVIRNAGGDVQKALPDMLAIDSLLRMTDLVVIRHTDCGTTHYHDEDVRSVVKGREGMTAELKEQVDAMRFRAVSDGVEAALKRDLEYLRSSPMVRQELRGNIAGFVYDLETGKLNALG